KAVTSVQPRVGASVWIGSGVLRAAFQQRTRPWAALSTLGPVATAGVALDDTLVKPGGDQQRARLQLDWEWSSRTFTTVFADTQRVDNSLSVHGLESLLGQLQGLFGQSASTAEARYAEALSDLRDIARDASRLNVATQSLLEGAANVGSGRATTMGVAVNRVLTRQLSVASHYRHANSSGVTTFFLWADESSRGQDLAFLPRHVLSLATTWVSPRRIYLNGEAIYRSARFESSYRRAGETLVRRERLADWTARLTGSWESRNKRWVIEFAATDLLAKSHSASYQLTAKVRR
ncbi:MAG: hypothetical protein Q8L75_04850, partial [Acidobacteriota bacterium]|nr:hypothetical protein [Acidobacteriota bacterium]